MAENAPGTMSLVLLDEVVTMDEMLLGLVIVSYLLLHYRRTLILLSYRMMFRLAKKKNASIRTLTFSMTETSPGVSAILKTVLLLPRTSTTKLPMSQSPEETTFDWDIPDDIGDRQHGSTVMPDRGDLSKPMANAAAREWESVANSNGIALDKTKKLIKKMSKQGKLLEAALEKANKRASKARDCEARANKAQASANYSTCLITSERESHKAEVTNLKNALSKAEKEEKAAKDEQSTLNTRIINLENELKIEQAKNISLASDNKVLVSNLATANALKKAAIQELGHYKTDDRTERRRESTIIMKNQAQEERVVQKHTQRDNQYNRAISGNGFRSGNSVVLPRVTPRSNEDPPIIYDKRYRFNNPPPQHFDDGRGQFFGQQVYDSRRYPKRISIPWFLCNNISFQMNIRMHNQWSLPVECLASTLVVDRRLISRLKCQIYLVHYTLVLNNALILNNNKRLLTTRILPIHQPLRSIITITMVNSIVSISQKMRPAIRTLSL